MTTVPIPNGTAAVAGDSKDLHAAEVREIASNGSTPGVATPEVDGPALLNGVAAPVSTDDTKPAPPTSYPKSRITLVDRCIDEPRPLRVAVIGGGLAGVLAGILLPAKVPNINLTIYEKNANFGGTWFENVYPGVRCDIPSHVYQSTFAPKTDWSDIFAPGAEIREYWQSTARKFDVYQYAKFGQKVEGASWQSDKGLWQLTVRDVNSGETVVADFDFVLTAVGRFNAWKLPDYPGRSDYKGILRHASHWDPEYDFSGKKVAVIGNGASGIQLVSNLQPRVGRLDHYARNKTWISPSWAGDERTLAPQPIAEELKKAWEDPKTYLKFRKEFEDKYWRRGRTLIKGSQENKESRENFVKYMTERVAKKPELLKDLIPDFSPNCRRLTPGAGYLEALSEDNVDYVRTPIKRFTETGIETVDGVHREVDAIFCATGANVDMVPAFPIRANGQDLRDLWKPEGGVYGFPYTYMGVATPGFPNLLFVHGPHAAGPAGTVPHAVETQLVYFTKILRKAAREGIKAITPSKAATDDFVEYSDAFFANTVLAEGCSSWYNGGRPFGRIHGIWPGSAGHLTAVRREPRWEDFEYEYLSETGNRFAWYFGNGYTRKELDPTSDMTPYLRLPEQVDLRDVHESWWDLP